MLSVEFMGYVVFENGEVWSNKCNRILRQYTNRSGYKYIRLYYNGVSNNWTIHRLVATLFIDNPQNLPQVNHKDGNKENNHVSNLEWCTAFYNNKHARDMGLNNVSKSNHDRWENDDFRSRTSSKISKTQLERKCSSGRNNGNWKYSILYDGVPIDRCDLPNRLGLSQSSCDRWIFEIANGKRINDHLTVINTKGQSTIERIG